MSEPAAPPDGARDLLPTFDTTRGSLAEERFIRETLAAGYTEMSGSEWPFEENLDGDNDVIFRNSENDLVYLLSNGSLVHARAGSGWLTVRVAAPTREDVTETLVAFREAYPPIYRHVQEDGTPVVPITFWTYGKWGPQSRLRMIEAAPWEEITRNYTAGVRSQLDAMMNGFEPGKNGQLILWQGPPGTGKTWALRALASEWNEWAEFNYITDPDAFFVDAPDYMIDVLLHDSYESIDEPSGAIVTGEQREGKWRVLILEDTGELLSANAKEKYGQGLSRLLNVVDGMIGQGLRVLVLVTTNDELGELNAAVRRPGRCASQIEFAPMTRDEVIEWLGDDTGDIEGASLAELYARMGAARDADVLAAAGELIPIPGTDYSIPRDAFDAALAMVREARAEDELEEIIELARSPLPPLDGCWQELYVYMVGRGRDPESAAHACGVTAADVDRARSVSQDFAAALDAAVTPA